MQSKVEDARFMERTMTNRGCDTPFRAWAHAKPAFYGRIASGATGIGAAALIRMLAGPLGGIVPGSSVPSGRRLRT